MKGCADVLHYIKCLAVRCAGGSPLIHYGDKTMLAWVMMMVTVSGVGKCGRQGKTHGEECRFSLPENRFNLLDGVRFFLGRNIYSSSLLRNVQVIV